MCRKYGAVENLQVINKLCVVKFENVFEDYYILDNKYL